MPVSLVSTLGRTVPYITLAELEQSPIYNQLRKLIPDQLEGERDAQLEAIIRRATSMINGEVHQNLAATVDTEIAQVRVSHDGSLRLHTRSSPIVEVLSIAIGNDPSNLVPIADLSNLVVDPWRITVPMVGRNACLNVSSSRSGHMWAKWSYINGFPVTTFAVQANAGDTSVTVVDATGVIAGTTVLTVEDGRSVEQFIPTDVTGNVLTVPDGLLSAHQVGTGVTGLPDVIKEATLLLISRLHDTWSLTMNVVDMNGNGARKPKADPKRIMCDAALMLAPYRRVW